MSYDQNPQIDCLVMSVDYNHPVCLVFFYQALAITPMLPDLRKARVPLHKCGRHRRSRGHRCSMPKLRRVQGRTFDINPRHSMCAIYLYP